MNIIERTKIIEILQEIITIDDLELKNCALESLIDMLEEDQSTKSRKEE